jgi:hypothetical protein
MSRTRTMPIKFTGGEGAIGGDGPVADQRVKKNAAPSFVAKPGNGSAGDRPLGLVDLDARVAGLEARVDAQAAQIEALKDELQALKTPVVDVDSTWDQQTPRLPVASTTGSMRGIASWPPSRVSPSPSYASSRPSRRRLPISSG